MFVLLQVCFVITYEYGFLVTNTVMPKRVSTQIIRFPFNLICGDHIERVLHRAFSMEVNQANKFLLVEECIQVLFEILETKYVSM